VQAPAFTARNLTIANSFDINRERPAGATAFQAVALALTGASDRALIEDCDVTGFQDTLLTDAGRSLFRRCRITGTVDFIFGAGTAFFDRCEIVSRYRQMPGEGRLGYLAAPSTLIDSPYGLVFDRCRLTREAGVPDGSVALGRPWRPTTTFPDGRYGNPMAVGQAVFLRCWMDRHIDAKGWDPMAYNGKDGQRAWLQPQDARFFEFKSQGPGAMQGPVRRQLSATEAAAFSSARVLGGWPRA
jgi:pectinesterase